MLEAYSFLICSKSHFNYWVGGNLLQIADFGHFELPPKIVGLCQRSKIHLGAFFENTKDWAANAKKKPLKTFRTKNFHINPECYQCLCLIFTSRGFFQC